MRSNINTILRRDDKGVDIADGFKRGLDARDGVDVAGGFKRDVDT